MDYEPSDSFVDIFEVDTRDVALVQALEGKGGGPRAVRAMKWHAVTALLNATHPDISFAFTEDAVIEYVQQAFANDERFDEATERLAAENTQGCPLDENNDDDDDNDRGKGRDKGDEEDKGRNGDDNDEDKDKEEGKDKDEKEDKGSNDRGRGRGRASEVLDQIFSDTPLKRKIEEIKAIIDTSAPRDFLDLKPALLLRGE